MDSYRFILSGGGTGGHIYPAIAIADELKKRYPTAAFLFVGAKDRMEMEKVPKAGYPIEGLWISGLQRKLTLKNVLFPIKLMSSLMRSYHIVNRFKPHLVVGTGGFASGPLVRVAAAKGIPCVLQEQNSHAGITNKWLGDKVAKICVAYEGMGRFFPSEKVILTGNPVRQDLVDLKMDGQEAFDFFGLDRGKKTVLVLGGSLGARSITQLIADKMSLFEERDIQLIWQCGKGYFDTYKEYTSKTVKVFDFLNRMDAAFTAADVIISRAGAGTVSELSIVGKPVLFVPSPNVAEDHQTKNALALVEKSAALMLRESELNDNFDAVFTELLDSGKKQRELAGHIGKMARPHATRDIVDEIEELLKALPPKGSKG
ncbi:MAG: undecaprenyldiphospho-muramoylpentapeptide beta-N-acetylglucosaminyltransferase [Flavobacteriaceae bacterium]